MDLYRAIRDLREEKKRLDALIAHLEGSQQPARRGRKGMNRGERRAASERMKEYWARRKAENQAGAETEEAPCPVAGPSTS
jgi:hypothetical protein